MLGWIKNKFPVPEVIDFDFDNSNSLGTIEDKDCARTMTVFLKDEAQLLAQRCASENNLVPFPYEVLGLTLLGAPD